MKYKDKDVFVETVTERIRDSIVASNIREATESDVKRAEELNEHGKCDHSIVYDRDCHPYYVRCCAVCGQGLGAL